MLLFESLTDDIWQQICWQLLSRDWQVSTYLLSPCLFSNDYDLLMLGMMSVPEE
jgi:hypothetical protein